MQIIRDTKTGQYRPWHTDDLPLFQHCCCGMIAVVDIHYWLPVFAAHNIFVFIAEESEVVNAIKDGKQIAGPLCTKLEDLAKYASQHRMTPEEIEAQRKSWVIGEIMMQHPKLSRAEATHIYNTALPGGKNA